MTSKRKDLTKAVAKIADQKPVTTAAVRKSAQAANREEVLAHPTAAKHTDWLWKIAHGEIEAPPAVQSLALKELHNHLYGPEEQRDKRSTDKVTINILGIGGGEATGITIDGSTGEAEADNG